MTCVHGSVGVAIIYFYLKSHKIPETDSKFREIGLKGGVFQEEIS